MSAKRRKYTPEFREQAARLVIETGRPMSISGIHAPVRESNANPAMVAAGS
jgi:transposase-like protein